jgi:hypothetical protein
MPENLQDPDKYVWNPREKKFVTRAEDKELVHKQEVDDISSGKEMPYVRKNREYSENFQKNKNEEESKQKANAPALLAEKQINAEKAELESLKKDPLIYGKNPIGFAAGPKATALKNREGAMRSRIAELEGREHIRSEETTKKEDEIGKQISADLDKVTSNAYNEDNSKWLDKQILKDLPSDISGKIEHNTTLKGKTPEQIQEIIKTDAEHVAVDIEKEKKSPVLKWKQILGEQPFFDPLYELRTPIDNLGIHKKLYEKEKGNP